MIHEQYSGLIAELRAIRALLEALLRAQDAQLAATTRQTDVARQGAPHVR